MSAPQITRVDIEEELKAKERGECLACRIGSTHMWNPSCEETPARELMSKCNINHMFNSDWFTKCPICFPGDTPNG